MKHFEVQVKVVSKKETKERRFANQSSKYVSIREKFRFEGAVTLKQQRARFQERGKDT
jgi:hypothetical protein